MAIDIQWLKRVIERRKKEADEAGARLHPPAMVNEVLEFLRVRELKKGVFVDMTVGTGGHTLAILQANPKVEVIGIDRDSNSLEVAAERLADYADRVTLIYGDMRDVKRLLQQVGVDRVDGCLIDPGPSLWQMDSKRGFSFLDDSPLDMRMDQSAQVTAQTLLQTLSADELERLFVQVGERRSDARRIAQAIVKERSRSGGIPTAKALAELIMQVKGVRGGRIHPATKVFLALRMTVNEEIDALKGGIMEGVKVLKRGGRLVVLSYQSLEDKTVKETFAILAQQPDEGENRPLLRILTKDPILPSFQERQQNPRARSCKLRAAERIR
ncbi:MAG: 16S rRNA (cytosine(1402)-N(4))-methyltransferase RsmH [Armatimonadetes bacterium]|nr:16S rRNA (cytosine(1402)-N(4))-methyltransferase RsmH [Armatimonadota bacterium]MCX7967475.1 16S rRNA (cytosine(1402)-N(4))-methyltransferase RsmH [Armatimonadota bacterium]MDW8143505.1 16S rRNA (cytosine(1402)-N(4))-methyltransferase RsmH [Armatimonadota bacterium]